MVINKTNTQQPLNSILGVLNGSGVRNFTITVSELEQSRSVLTNLARANVISWAVIEDEDDSNDSTEFMSKSQVEELVNNSSTPSPIVWTTEGDNETDNLVATFLNLHPITVDPTSDGVVALGGCLAVDDSMIEGSFCGILSGTLNKIWSDYTVIPGGQNNKIGDESAADFSNIGGGRNNDIRSTDSVISGGSGNQTHSSWSTVSGGRDNAVWSSASYSSIVGGFGNRCEGPGSQAGGIQAYARYAGSRAFAAGQYAEVMGVVGEDYGNQQVTEIVLRGETPGLAANEVTHLKAGGFFDVPTGTMQPQDNKTYYIETKLVARKNNGTSKVFFNRTLASYAGSTPTYVGSNDAGQAISVGSPNALWNVVVSHNEGIDVAFNTGSGVTDKVRVVAYVKMVEVFSADP
jgi:hypothetical protein